MNLLRCEGCGKIVAVVKGSTCPTKCCGEPMVEMVPNTTDGAHEKHVPVIKVEGNLVTVTVGSVEHPMLEEHSIEWIMLETKEGRQRKTLKPGMKPQAVFAITEGDEVVAAYEYCNLHGFWKAEI
ncbi:MAG: desulfoferrodoxin [Lachnospiraceae bacterium]|nr:desulfoferrodoxin [Lachnospiraceae bacterium]